MTSASSITSPETRLRSTRDDILSQDSYIFYECSKRIFLIWCALKKRFEEAFPDRYGEKSQFYEKRALCNRQALTSSRASANRSCTYDFVLDLSSHAADTTVDPGAGCKTVTQKPSPPLLTCLASKIVHLILPASSDSESFCTAEQVFARAVWSSAMSSAGRKPFFSAWSSKVVRQVGMTCGVLVVP